MPKSSSKLSIRFWHFHWLGRALKFAAANALGGAWVGALIGFSNWYASRGTGEPWWHWTGLTAFCNAIWMGVFGFCAGVLLFLMVAAISARWKAPRHWQLARNINFHLLLPVVLSLILTSDIAALFLILGVIPRTTDLGNILGAVELATLASSALFFALTLIFSARRTRKRVARIGSRLLPVR